VRTFNIGFPSREFDERNYARLAASFHGTNHAELEVTPDCFEVLPVLSHHYDEPLADSSAIPTYYVSRITRRHVTVAVSGTCGDECFAGYLRYWALETASLLRRAPFPVHTFARWIAYRSRSSSRSSFISRIRRFASGIDEPPASRYRRWMTFFEPDAIVEMINPEILSGDSLKAASDWFEGFFREGEKFGVTHAAMYTDENAYIPCDLNVKEDIASMAVSLEVRSPFMDHKLVELAASFPQKWKKKGRYGKRILKDAFGDLLPPSIRKRRKLGFGVPLVHWFRSELVDYVRETLLSPDAGINKWVNRDIVRRYFEEHLSGNFDHSHRLWSLLMLELWQKKWLK
jgi:asparagine synthase (glutamine-hydrolysing)